MRGEIKTPCIGVCSTIYGDDVCRGCHRFFDEIIQWNALSAEQRQTTWTRLEQLQIKHSSTYFAITNKTLLRQALTNLNISFNPNSNPALWAYNLIRSQHSKLDINNLAKTVGISLNIKTNQNINQKPSITLSNLVTKIDEAIYTESVEILTKQTLTKIL